MKMSYQGWKDKTAAFKKIDVRGVQGNFFPLIDEKLGNIAVNFWDLTWNDEYRHLPYEIRLLLSLTNAVGAGRMRQATRELVKAYIYGLDNAALACRTSRSNGKSDLQCFQR